MLTEAGVQVVPITYPEQFKSAAFARSMGLDGPAHPHLIFRSTEEIRPIAGAYNIACFAWEFDVLSTPGLAHQPVLDQQTSMLAACDEIWAPSSFTEKVLRNHGLTNTRLIPSPVFPPLAPRPQDKSSLAEVADVLSCETASFSANFLFGYEADIESDYEALEQRYARPLGRQRRLAEVVDKGGRIFLSVLNPYDKRKNLATMIDGFLLAAQGHDDMVLVLKLITSGVVEGPAGYLYHQLRLILGHPHCLHDDRIILVGGYLSDAQMGALFNAADYYLCTSIAEGQNAPILESMAYGCCPISTRNTAMADYLDDANSVSIGERRYSGIISGLAGDVASRPYAVDYCDRFAVADAISQAMDLTPGDLERMGAAARAAVQASHATSTVTPKILKRLAEVQRALDARRG
jgi:glycosyltransferase involved in cell wall biosynthesis